MFTSIKQCKDAIRSFMQRYYTDERLAELLAHAQEGKLSYDSCCCFIGVVTANHPLRGKAETLDCSYGNLDSHLWRARDLLSGSDDAEMAFYLLSSGKGLREHGDEKRRRILIPMIRAEMKRREWKRKQEEILKEVAWA